MAGALRGLGLAAALLLRAAASLDAQVPVDSVSALEERAYAAYESGTRDGTEEAVRLFLRLADLQLARGDSGAAGQTFASIGTLQTNLGRADSAFHYYERALPVLRAAGDRVSEGTVIALVGQTHHSRGDLRSALRYYEEALAILHAAGDAGGESLALNNLGIAQGELGIPDSALVLLRRSLAIRRTTGDVQGEAQTLNNLARIHQVLGQPDSAVGYLRRSLALHREGGDRRGVGQILNNLGYAYELWAKPDSALSYYREAVPVLRETGNATVEALTHTNLGRVLLAAGTPVSALLEAHLGLDIARKLDDRHGESWALDDLGRIHEALGAADSALHYFREALLAMREIGDRAREGRTLYHLARFHHRGAPTPDLAAAVAFYDSAAAARASVGARAGGDANQVSFAEQDVRLFEEWALAWLARAPELGSDHAARAALAAAERGRAQALLDLMRDSSSARPAGADLAAEGARLAAAGRPGTATVSYLAAADTLVVFLATPDGRLAVARRAVGADSLATLIATWRAGLGVDEGFVPAGQIDTRRALPPLETPRGIGTARRCAAPDARGIGIGRARCVPSEEEFRRLGEQLASLLVPAELHPEMPAEGTLVVVPHGPLALVPFAALPLASERRLAIRYAPSLGTLAAAEARTGVGAAQRRSAMVGALVVGNPSMPRVQLADGAELPLPPLAGAEREGRWVAELVGAEAMLGSEATETRVRERLGTAPLVHLATHGFAYSSDARARESFVALAPGEGQDGLLRVREVLEDVSPLRADLVVLSACQTGLGDIKQAEGTVGLQRAFLARGARSVLVSLWSVSDEATDALMKGFYTHWLEDGDAPDKAEALRRAQEELRATNRFSHPRFWAAFQLVGAS